MPLKMTPIEPAADDTFVVGDPRRAFALAQKLMVQPRMSHQARGLWGYRGKSKAGRDLTVQSTGAGGTSAATIIDDLVNQGAKRILRLGTCLGVDPELSAGDVILVEKALAADGASRALSGEADYLTPSSTLFEQLKGIGQVGVVSSHDLVQRLEPNSIPPLPEAATVRDLQTAASFAICRNLSIPVAAVLVVTESKPGQTLDEEETWAVTGETGIEILDRLD